MKTAPRDTHADDTLAELERRVYAALETYSNVHRGSGHNSVVSTHLFEQARKIVLEYLGLDERRHVVIFCTPRRAAELTASLEAGSYRIVSSQDVGLPLGVRALAVRRTALPEGAPFQSGGGTARLVAPDWVIWAAVPDRFEAGTPAIVNVIAFANALRLTQMLEPGVIRSANAEPLSAADLVHVDDLAAYSGRELLDRLRRTLIGRDVRVPTTQGERPYVNLDNGASTPTFEPIWEAARRTWHQPVAERQAIVADVRSVCAAFLDAPLAEYDVIFTSNTTEAINLVAESLGNERESGIESAVVNTLLEHNSNELPWRAVAGASLVRLSIDADGFVDVAELENVLRIRNEGAESGIGRVKLVSVSGASNVIGVYNDLEAISRIVHRYGARLLVDGAQMVAHRAVSMRDCGIDYLAFSAHKAYAPFGTGVLVARRGLLTFSPTEMESICASGEENTMGIAALGEALALLGRIGLDIVQAEEAALTTRALLGIAGVPRLTIHGISDPASRAFARRGGVIAFSLKGANPHQVARQLSERAGIGVRAGCHCAHLLVKHLLGISPLVERLQRLIVTVFPAVELPGVTRASLGIENTEEDVDTLIRVLGEIAMRPRAAAAADSGSPRSKTSASARKHIQAQVGASVRAAAQRVFARADAG